MPNAINSYTGIARTRVRPGPKLALQPRSLNSLNQRMCTRIPKKNRESYTREFKLHTLSMLQKSRVDEDGEVVPAGTIWVSMQLGISKKKCCGRVQARESCKGSRKVEKIGKSNRTIWGKSYMIDF